MDSQWFFEEVKKKFLYLVAEYRFAEPTLEIDPQIHFSTATYMGKNLAVELILDPREEWVDCKIAKVIDGRKTGFYAVDQKGIQVRGELVEILEQKDARGIRFTRAKKKETFEDRVQNLLADYASILKNYGQEILRDSPAIFS